MFDFLRSQPFHDEVLGELARSRGRWRGRLRLAEADAPLALVGDRKSPDDAARQEARAIGERFSSMRRLIAEAILEHAGPYLEERHNLADEGDDAPTFTLESAEDIWKYAKLEYVSVEPMDGGMTTEFGYTVPWDDEHTLGLRFRGTQFVELSGSVLAP